ncbi:MAG: hypothetical protein H3C35_11410 [Bacteroidetes bacterium]|nr:hypothetical protein [Bacteroidota bacterium]
MYFALLYHLADDYLTRRTEFREEHLRLANESSAQGEMVLGGAFTDPADTALLIFKTEDKTIIENFVQHDPYVINGLVLRYEIRSWNVVIGG